MYNCAIVLKLVSHKVLHQLELPGRTFIAHQPALDPVVLVQLILGKQLALNQRLLIRLDLMRHNLVDVDVAILRQCQLIFLARLPLSILR